jgi:cell division protein FtsW
MVTSASLASANHQFHSPLHFFYRQSAYLFCSAILVILIRQIPLKLWRAQGILLMIVTNLLLLALLIPGMGLKINGATRWLKLGPLHFQISEWAKLAMIIYLASYFDRQNQAIKNVKHYLKPMIPTAFTALFLLMEPDFGSTMVISLVACALLFLAGMPIMFFMTISSLSALIMSYLAWSAPYRLARLSSFLNPWANPFSSGYQLTQALMALGRGGIWGVGLGNGMQKWLYLPEAHTDFIFAVTVEELGAVSALILLILYACIVMKSLKIGLAYHKKNHIFEALLSYGLGIWIALQTCISIGVNIGLLPTKGLVLPFFSYGGSSLFVNAMAIGLLLRLDYENAV